MNQELSIEEKLKGSDFFEVFKELPDKYTIFPEEFEDTIEYGLFSLTYHKALLLNLNLHSVVRIKGRLLTEKKTEVKIIDTNKGTTILKRTKKKVVSTPISDREFIKNLMKSKGYSERRIKEVFDKIVVKRKPK